MLILQFTTWTDVTCAARLVPVRSLQKISQAKSLQTKSKASFPAVVHSFDVASAVSGKQIHGLGCGYRSSQCNVTIVARAFSSPFLRTPAFSR